MVKLPTVYSQRDGRWASILLGYNTDPKYTIGMYGCLITCLGMLSNKTPDVVNKLLVDNQGYVAGTGNFIWSKCTVVGLNQLALSYSWDGPVTDNGVALAKQWLDKGNALMCEIDFNPATSGEEMHYVLCIGYEGEDFFMADPWTGNIDSFDVYGGFRRAVIQFRVYDPVFPTTTATQSVMVEAPVFENLVRKSTIYDWILSKLNVQDSQTIVQAEITKLIDYEDAVAQKDRQLAESRDMITALQKSAEDKEKELKSLQEDIGQLMFRVNEAVAQNKDLQARLADAQQAAQQPIFKGWKKWIYDRLIK